MDKKFLNRVVGRLVNETIIVYVKEEIYSVPFAPSFLSYPFPPSLFSHSFFPPAFNKHCKEIYSLNEQEIEYLWIEYKNIIKDKMFDDQLV